jgi:pilus assembly protein CpaF
MLSEPESGPLPIHQHASRESISHRELAGLERPGRQRSLLAAERATVRALRSEVAAALAQGTGRGDLDRRSALARNELHRGDRIEASRLIEEAIRARRPPHSSAAQLSAIELTETEELVVREVLAALFGLGPLQQFIDDPSVENIDVNGCERVFLSYADGTSELTGPAADSDEELVATLRSVAARCGLSERRFDAAQPELDLRLEDGSRLSAVMAVTARPVVNIRRNRLSDIRLEDLEQLGMFDADLGAFLRAAVRARANLLVSGPMNAGKTTLLRALASEIAPDERLVTIEQVLELGLDLAPDRHPNCIALEARPANTEGQGEIDMARLVRRSLRMNASRVVIGEVLGHEVVPMLNAMSQGCAGSMATIHANSSAGAFRRLASYAVQAPERLPLEATNLLVAGSIDFVIHCAVTDHRQVVSVREVVDAEGSIVISNELWRLDPDRGVVACSPCSERRSQLLRRDGYAPTGLGNVRWLS